MTLSNIEDLLNTLDEDDAKAIRAALGEKDDLLKAKARAERDLSLATDDGLKERYPRAWRAYQKKRLDFGDTTDPEQVTAILKAKEEELAELGVPAGEATPQTQAPPVVAGTPAPDPGEVFGTPVSGGAPSVARNLTQEFLESMKADTPTDRNRMADIIAEMNAKGAQDEIEKLVDILNARPIISRDVTF